MKKVMFVLAMFALGTLCWAGSAREDATDRLDNATTVLHEIMGMPDKGIPEEVLEHAKCVAVIPHMVKGGFVFGGKGGKARCHLPHGEWLECTSVHHDFGRKLGPADRCRSCGHSNDLSE